MNGWRPNSRRKSRSWRWSWRFCGWRRRKSRNDGRRRKTEGGDGETGGGNFTEKGGAAVGGARGVPEELGGRERSSGKLQDGGGAPVLELHGAGAGVHPGGVSGR